MVVPQYKRTTHPQSIDFTTIFIVQHHKHAVFFVEIKPSGHLRTISDCSAIDQQIREGFDALADQLSILTLYGISALGTKLCIYTYDSVTGTLEPEALKWIREELTKELPSSVGTSM
ncbi:hypothetical protein PAXINDRAFT_140371 [Paxillus involutus ATCC 200175]|uniref:Uncharacterized protein n=1 Tax=Paxillus involutus ATCC 200175 TaxID=664439 RepID=A0A0C9TFM1_PAXIN|nr:hypothetical protein PAXINDRAFT_140371 [Paxillus involutus ATCC 200175]